VHLHTGNLSVKRNIVVCAEKLNHRHKTSGTHQCNVAVPRPVLHPYPGNNRGRVLGYPDDPGSLGPAAVSPVCRAKHSHSSLVRTAPVQPVVVPNNDCLARARDIGRNHLYYVVLVWISGTLTDGLSTSATSSLLMEPTHGFPISDFAFGATLAYDVLGTCQKTSSGVLQRSIKNRNKKVDSIAVEHQIR
jgi:hypothetical protein